uniref:Uncharacterized protein n=1 Tax=Leersia perrieri TaxID=77586 RepID=A0A0D9WGM0_9ORYZ
MWYAGEVTTFVEKRRMHGLTGVKSKEVLIWVSLSEIVVSPSGTKIVFCSPAGLSRAFPVIASQLNPPPPAEKKEETAATANGSEESNR